MAPVLPLARASDDSDFTGPLPWRRLLERWTSPEAISSPADPLPRSPASISARSPLSNLFGRQSTTAIIPASYGNIDSGPSPGTVVGAVLGSVAGFLLLLWLFYSCMSRNGSFWIRETTESEVIVRRPHKSRSRRASEKVEVRRSRSRPVAQETIIVEEERTRRRSASMSRSSASDEVVVIEEHSPPRKSKKKGRRDSGFRTVDPSAYGGVIGGNRRSR
ncbi:hypothetical protein F5884DRAFT_38072 [Xylogone sp. PMI_703]|nr:hypothetical protein F5884DRAFT_38072 [Xylogone sp. PMI_703]